MEGYDYGKQKHVTGYDKCLNAGEGGVEKQLSL
jgi:hypothetical protein